MVVDTSALIAMLDKEAGWEGLYKKVDTATRVVVPTPAIVEACLVLSRRYDARAVEILDGLLLSIRATKVGFSDIHASAAFMAFLLFGKGRGNGTLNFGDCMVYAVAKVMNQPLLFVGDDFKRTDIVAA